MHKFRIEMDTATRGRVYMDGQQLQGVKEVAFKAGVDSIAEVTLTIVAGEFECDTAEVKEIS